MENKYRIEVGNVNVYTDDRTFPIDVVKMVLHVGVSSIGVHKTKVLQGHGERFKEYKKQDDNTLISESKIPESKDDLSLSVEKSKPSGTVEENSKGYTIYFDNSHTGISRHNVIICQKILSDLYETSKMAVDIGSIHMKTDLSKSQIALAMKVLVWKDTITLTKIGMINYYTPKQSADAHVEVAGTPK